MTRGPFRGAAGLMPLLATLAFLGGVPSALAESVRWRDDADRAIQDARRDARPVLLHFSQAGCAPCRLMEMHALSDPDVVSASRGFVAIHVTAEEHPHLVNRYGVGAFPSDVILGTDGQVLETRRGNATAANYAAFLRRSVMIATAPNPAAMREQLDRDAAEAAANSNAVATAGPKSPGRSPVSTRPAGSEPIPSWLAEMDARQMQASKPSTTELSASSAERSGRPLGGPLSQNAAGEPSWMDAAEDAAPRPRATMAAAQPASAAASRDPAAAMANTLDSPPQRPWSSELTGGDAPAGAGAFGGNPSRSGGFDSKVATAGPTPGASAPWESAPWESDEFSPASAELALEMSAGRPASASRDLASTSADPLTSNVRLVAHDQADLGRPQPAMHGCCPVSLLGSAEWVNGDSKIGAWHRGRLYYFASREMRDQFLADPDRFAPAFGGYDVVEYVERGRWAEGDGTFGTVDGQDRMFFFVTGDNQAAFEADSDAGGAQKYLKAFERFMAGAER